MSGPSCYITLACRQPLTLVLLGQEGMSSVQGLLRSSYVDTAEGCSAACADRETEMPQFLYRRPDIINPIRQLQS